MPHGITKVDRKMHNVCFTIFGRFDSAVLVLSIGSNMQATLCVDILDDTMMDDFDLKGIIHYD